MGMNYTKGWMYQFSDNLAEKLGDTRAQEGKGIEHDKTQVQQIREGSADQG